MQCKGCGSTKINNNICEYCGRKHIEKPISKLKIIKSNMGNYKVLKDTELKGNMNTIVYAENCIIKGNMNDIQSYKNITVIGNMNKY